MNKKTQQTLFSSAKQDWATPWDVFEWACRGYRPTQDVCATAENTKCGASYYDRNMDGLRQDWTGVCWMNPPYGREIGRWVKKAHDSAQEGATVICLLPARTDTKWWHSYVEPIRRGDFPGEIRFYKGRVKFIGAKASAPFPSVVVIFGPDYHHFSTATVNLSRFEPKNTSQPNTAETRFLSVVSVHSTDDPLRNPMPSNKTPGSASQR